MATMFCALCNRPVEARREFGIGTIVLAFLTGGLSLLAIPFYSKRCAICKSPAVSPLAPDGTPANKTLPQLARVKELEAKLDQFVGELEQANTEIERLRSERDFYRQLIGDRVDTEGRPLPSD